MRRLTWFGAVLLIVIIAADLKTSVSDRAPAVKVTTESVSTGSIARDVIARGAVQALTTVDVGSQISGRIQSLEADDNSIVRMGQVLARVDASFFESALSETEAGLAQAEADEAELETFAKEAHEQLERSVVLTAQQLIPESDLEAARSAADQASENVAGGEARIAEAKAALEQASVDLGHTIIHSPVDGIVLERSVDIGQTIAAGLQSPLMFRIGTDLRHLQVEVDIDQSDVGLVNPGEPASLKVDAYPEETFHGVVATHPSAAAGPVVSYATIVEVANPDEKLRPGMTATVFFAALHRDHVVRIPNDALMFHPSADVLRATKALESPLLPQNVPPHGVGQVWRFDGAHFTPIEVRVGLADDRWTELVSGTLKIGELLVTNASVVNDQTH